MTYKMTSILGRRTYDQAFGALAPYAGRIVRPIAPAILGRSSYRMRGPVPKRINSMNMRRFRKNIRRIVNQGKETHFVDYAWGKHELYHNDWSVPAQPGAFKALLNDPVCLPPQGDGDSNRTGNDIIGRGIQMKLMFGMKADRHNTTFRVMVLRVTKGYSISSYTNVFDNQTGNIMLDAVDKDRVKVLYDKKHTQKVDVNSYNANKEITFFRKFYIPHKALYKFYDDGTQQNSYPFDIYLCVLAYDAYGTLTTDNIGYVQSWSRFYFKDK